MSIEAEWIEWSGGSTAPLNTGTIVDVKTRNGSQRLAIQVNELTIGYPCTSHAFWHHDDGPYDITAYRIHNAFEGAPDEATHLLGYDGMWAFTKLCDGKYYNPDGVLESPYKIAPDAWQVIATRKREESEPVRHYKPVTAHNTVEAALKHMQDRAATYDKPAGERSMSATVEAFNAIAGTELTEEQGWMFMALLKIVRSQQGKFKADNYEDLAAYAGLMAEDGYSSRGT